MAKALDEGYEKDMSGYSKRIKTEIKRFC